MTATLVALLHGVLAAGACYGLWRLWRLWFGAADRRVVWLAGAGFLLRAFLGQALFWISYLRAPIGRSLQIGDGIWFFGSDGWWYLANAHYLAVRGLAETLFSEKRFAAHIFVQLMAGFVALFGYLASIALLLNLAAYVATCALIVRLQPRVNGAVLFALGAVAFGPGTLVWSLQPLKDTVFQLLMAAFIFACSRWQERRSAGPAVAVVLLTFVLAGIRWYFGAIVWVACGIFFLMVLGRATRRGLVFAASVLVFLLMSQSVRLGAAADMAPALGRFLAPAEIIATLWHPGQVVRTIARVRRGFEETPGATNIAPGPALAAAKPAPAVSTPPVQTASAATTTTAAVPTPAPVPVAAPPPQTTATAAPPTTTTTAPPATTTTIAPPATTATTAPRPTATTTPAPPTTTTVTPTTTTAAPPPPTKTAPPLTTTIAPPPTTTTIAPPPPSTTTTAPPPTATATTAPQPTPVVPSPPPAPVLSTSTRLFSGVAAAFLPRFIAQPLGLIHVGGGRGLWMFAELDTLAFDAVLVFALVYIVRGRRRITPLFLMVLLILAVTAGPMVYTVNNFGTLFRLREMLYFLAAVLPVTLAPDARA